MKEGSGSGHLFPWGPHWETWKMAHMLGGYVWKKVLRWVSLPIGAPLGNQGRGEGELAEREVWLWSISLSLSIYIYI